MQIEKQVNTILEGCFHDTPSKLQYSELKTEIPINVKALLLTNSPNNGRFSLYATTEDFKELKINPNYSTQGGWPINKIDAHIPWLFEGLRSFTTRAGRIYIEQGYFRENWEWYLEAVPVILSDCKSIFDGRTTSGKLNNSPKRCF